MRPLALHLIYRFDRLRFAQFRWRWRHALHIDGTVSPNLRFARLRVDPGGRLELERGVVTERQPGNHIWIQSGGSLRLGRDTWLRTEYGTNAITVYPDARIGIGRGSLLNGAMLTAKREIEIGADARIGFGVRILDADLHDLDRETPERIEPIRIGDRVWLGADCLVLRGVTIGDDVAIAAGSIVTRDIPPRTLALGAPARPIRDLAPRTGCS
jgi:acetyltransferase-like isoleucine patch superfamily enzyme